jgi:5-carboxymethyl-2-hydroxymuconate isomerase
MPHCILEASDNLLDQPDWVGLLREINGTLVATGLFRAADIKSRFLRHQVFAIGDGSTDQAFVTLNVQILGGRTDEVMGQLSEALLPVLTRAFPRTFAQMKCSLTVQITDIHRPSYRRAISDSG